MRVACCGLIEYYAAAPKPVDSRGLRKFIALPEDPALAFVYYYIDMVFCVNAGRLCRPKHCQNRKVV